MSCHWSRSSSIEAESYLEKYIPVYEPAKAQKQGEAQASLRARSRAESKAKSKVNPMSDPGDVKSRVESVDSTEEAELSKLDPQSSMTRRPRIRKISSKVSTKIKSLIGKGKDESSPASSEEKLPIISNEQFVQPKLRLYESLEEKYGHVNSLSCTISQTVTYDDGRIEFESKTVIKQEKSNSSDLKAMDRDSGETLPRQRGKKQYDLSEYDDFFGIGKDDIKDENGGKPIADELSQQSRYTPTRAKSFKHQDQKEAATSDFQGFPEYKKAERDYQRNTDVDDTFVADRDMPAPRHISRDELESSQYAQHVKQEKQREKERESLRVKERERQRTVEALVGIRHKPSIKRLKQQDGDGDGDASPYDIKNWPYGEKGHKESYVVPRGIPHSLNNPALGDILEKSQEEREAAKEARRNQRQRYAERIEEARRKRNSREILNPAAFNAPSIEELRRRHAEAKKDGTRRVQYQKEEKQDQGGFDSFLLAQYGTRPQEPKSRQAEEVKEDARPMPQREAEAETRSAYSSPPQALMRSRYTTRDAFKKYRRDHQQERPDLKIKVLPYSKGYEGQAARKPSLPSQQEPQNPEDDADFIEEEPLEIPEFPKPPRPFLPPSMKSINMGPEELELYTSRHQLKRYELLENPLPRKSNVSFEQPNEELKNHVADYGPVSPLTPGFGQSMMPAPLNIRKKSLTPAKDAKVAIKKEEEEPAIQKDVERPIKQQEQVVAPVSRLPRYRKSSTAPPEAAKATLPASPAQAAPAAPALVTEEDPQKLNEHLQSLLEDLEKSFETEQAKMALYFRDFVKKLNDCDARLDRLMRFWGIDQKDI
ncbi:hypothetical protein F5Y05DRAFT_391845 [Hypoxylon sp. FL0543]|nr:hypothetical protein F5Y05DRAFT_391845 [Hypoxylon sp. FL0543]